LRPQRRLLRYLYTQDEWSFAKDWTLTAGVRHDDYSDFGGTTNPRLALVWEAAYNVTGKLLYGGAFRAPSFTETSAINNPVAIGNPNLRPEKMKTLEAAVSWQPAPKIQWGASIFRYEMTDIIRLDNNFTYQNAGEQTGSGAELEATWDVTRVLRIYGNYAYQRSIDETTQQDAGDAPHHQVYLRSDWRFTRRWLFNAQLNWIGERERVPGDARPSVPSYTTVDVTLRTDKVFDAWDIAFSVRNLFDEEAREPSPFGVPFVSIPNDFPLPGRSLYLQASYKFAPARTTPSGPSRSLISSR
jgi:iron complex outermembrane receptor protein